MALVHDIDGGVGAGCGSGSWGGPEITVEKGTLPVAAPRQRVVVATLLRRLLRAETC
jgi:hypothetical protein